MSNSKKTTAQVNLFKGGPIKVSGNFTITGVSGELLSVRPGEDAYLCACGRSGSKPFCDGSHRNEG